MTPSPQHTEDHTHPHPKCHDCEQFFKCEELPPCARPSPAPTEPCCISCPNIPCKPLNRIPCFHHPENVCIDNGCTDIENCDEICEHSRIYSPAWVKEHDAAIVAATQKEEREFWTNILLKLEKYGLEELHKTGHGGMLKSKEEISAYWAGYAAASRNAIGKALRRPSAPEQEDRR